MRTRRVVSACVMVPFALAVSATAAPPKATVPAVNPAAAAPVRPPVKTFPDLVVLAPTVQPGLVPASGPNPAGYKVVWRIKNQGAAATANRVELTLACEPVTMQRGAHASPQQAQQICFTLNNTSFLSYPPGVPPSTPAPLAAGQESEPFITLSTTAAASCMDWHARVTAVADADGKYDEGPIGEANNTKVFEICEMKAVQH